jgi:hypothetical protein
LRSSLSKAIYEYRRDWNGYLASTVDDDKALPTFRPALAVLETWGATAEDAEATEMALELALEFYEAGDSPVIPAMMKAALSWIQAERKRRAAP